MTNEIDLGFYILNFIQTNPMKTTLLVAVTILSILPIKAQDTFSIVAVDSVTGEVGSAGASCVDLDLAGLPTDDFIGVLVPGVGAINTQAWYLPANQNNATNRMQLGETPDQIISWLVANDVQGTPELRQYGVVTYNNGSPESAGYTGTSTDDYKNHVVGPNYAIQGNILLGQEILDSMEWYFLNTDGDLACKLMAALQGANTVGADTRCTGNGTSSLFAYVKVADTTDAFGSPSFLVSVRTGSSAGIEPIDSLQIIFNQVQSCPFFLETGSTDFDDHFEIFPNPADEAINISSLKGETGILEIYSMTGQIMHSQNLNYIDVVDVSTILPGNYIIKVICDDMTYVKNIVIV